VNWWLSEDDDHETASQAWAQTSTKPFHQRTQNLATSLKIWVKKKKTLPQPQQLATIEHELLEIQKQPPNLFNHSKEAPLTLAQ
jgi:hypothetical protein